MASRSVSTKDADAIREAEGTRNPNGTKVTYAQLARDYAISTMTVSNVVNFKGGYANDPNPALPDAMTSEIKKDLAEMQAKKSKLDVGHFMIWLMNTMRKDGDYLDGHDLRIKTNDLTLRDARKLRIILKQVVEILGTDLGY